MDRKKSTISKKGSIANRVGISIYCPCATKWLNLNNRGCLTHGKKENETSATKWLNYLQHCSAHFGAEDVCVISSVGLHPRLLIRQLADHPFRAMQRDIPSLGVSLYLGYPHQTS